MLAKIVYADVDNYKILLYHLLIRIILQYGNLVILSGGGTTTTTYRQYFDRPQESNNSDPWPRLQTVDFIIPSFSV